MVKKSGKRFATVTRAEVVEQYQQHAQRIGVEPDVEIYQNITLPRVTVADWNRPQRFVANRYAELRCNSVELRIKSRRLT